MFGFYNTLWRGDDRSTHKPLTLRGPNYYDNPEGTDPIGKLWGLNKYAVLTGLLTTSFDCLAISHTTNIREVANVAGFWFPPLIGCATAFASVTYIATDFRKKDDKLNYVLGGLACAPVLHIWKKNFEFTCWVTILFMVSAFLKKESIQDGWEFAISMGPRKYGNYFDDRNLSIVTEEWPKRPY